METVEVVGKVLYPYYCYELDLSPKVPQYCIMLGNNSKIDLYIKSRVSPRIVPSFLIAGTILLSKLERTLLSAWKEKKKVRIVGHSDDKNRFLADSVEFITNGELSLSDTTEQDGQLSFASDGGELSIAEE